MKTIIAGSRGISSMDEIVKAVEESGFTITEVVSGCARGADTAGLIWAAWAGVPTKKFPAEWKKNGKVAGFMRNVEMANYAEALIAVWNGKSSGTEHMIKVAKDRGLKVHVHYVLEGK